MSDIYSLGALLTITIGVGVFFYRALYKSDLRTRYKSLALELNQSYNSFTVKDCVINQNNYNLLSGFFFKIQLIDSYVKKFIPLLIALMLAALFFNVVNKKEVDFQLVATEGATEIAVSNKDGSESILEHGRLAYIDDQGEIYIVNTKKTGKRYSFGSAGVMSINPPVVITFIGVIMLIILLLAHHHFKVLCDFFSDTIMCNIDYWKNESRKIEREIERTNNLKPEDRLAERINALKDKQKFIGDLIEDMKKCHDNFSPS